MHLSPRYQNCLLRCLCALLLAASLPAAAQSMPPATPHLAGAAQLGQARLRVFVLVYDAALYVPQGFNAARLYDKPFALAITAGRAFRAESIVRQMVKELKQQDLPAATVLAYEQLFAQVMPAVEENDTLTGVYAPKQGWTLYFKGKAIGSWSDDAFAKAFFDIWLGANASQTQVKTSLLKQG